MTVREELEDYIAYLVESVGLVLDNQEPHASLRTAAFAILRDLSAAAQWGGDEDGLRSLLGGIGGGLVADVTGKPVTEDPGEFWIAPPQAVVNRWKLQVSEKLADLAKGRVGA